MTINEWFNSSNLNLKQAAAKLDIPIKLLQAYLDGECKVPHQVQLKMANPNFVIEKKKELTVDSLLKEINELPGTYFWINKKVFLEESLDPDILQLFHNYIQMSDILGFKTITKTIQINFNANPMNPHTKTTQEKISQFCVIDMINSDEEIDSKKINFLENYGVKYIFGKDSKSIINKIISE